MALTFIGQSVVSAIIDNLVDTCSSYLKACPAASGMQDELERLQDALPQVQAVLTAVEDGAPVMLQNKGLDRWLWQLRDAVENAENVLDELEYYELEKRIRDRDDKVRGNILSKCKTKFDSFFNRIFSDDTLKRLREAVKGLDRVVANIGLFHQITTGSYGPSVKNSETSCLLTESEVFGRDKERDKIVEWLIKQVDGESEGITFNVSAFTIVGMGGLGKTTLAQLIYQDERVQGNFDLTMWVCVSQDFDVATITSKMLAAIEIEEAKKNGKAINSGSFGDKHFLNTLHEIVKEKLTSKRFLLILDDVWDGDNLTEWEKLVVPLKFGQRGSKILLTTRTDLVADMAAKVTKCKRELLNLNKLEESDCMSLFNRHAFLGVNPDDYKNLQPIGEQIVKKLGGCPLAIKVMGGLLNSRKDDEYWKRILKEDTMKLQQGKDGIMTVLRLSYDHLPTNLQVCFRYCSIFPQDYEFKRKKLVYMWMGSGLISQSICGRQSPEDIGREYLDLLTRKSFFTCKTEDYGDKIYRYYVMHDLLHDLAQSVSLGECIRIGGDVAGNTIPRTVRHLSVEIIDLLSIREISNLKNLRTLVIFVKNNQIIDVDHELVFNEVIKRFKNLRLLSLSVNFEYNKLPDALDSLIHLRYLSISSDFTTYESFHFQSLYRLYHLVVMKLSFNQNPPMNIEYDVLTNLVNLRSLEPKFLIQNIPYLSKLPFIHKLEVFFVRDKSGYKISELKNLKDLRGHLSIRQFENVRNSEEVMEAKLKEKEYLKSLSLVWSKGCCNNVETDEQLLDKLCPHINLKRLCIEEYQGVKSPYWMTDLSLINLTFIELRDCNGWEHLPPLGGLRSLNGLHLTRLHAVKQIGCSFYGCGGGCSFPSLKDLEFWGMPNLEDWIGIDDCCMFPKLHTMKITRCPNLRGLPALPQCLNQLQIEDVGLTTLPAINENCGNNNQQEQFSDPETLTIEDCEKIQYLPTEFFQKFNTIKVLRIRNCPKLTTRGISDIQLPSILDERTVGSRGDLEVPLLCSANLTSLDLRKLHAVKKIDSLFFGSSRGCAFPSLKGLVFKDMPNLEEWIGIDDCCMFPKLHTMKITRCPNLRGLPALPQCLNQLRIKDVGLTTLPAINENCENNNQQEQFPARETLTIKHCEKLQYLPTEFFQKFNTIEDLRIINCPKLTTRGISDIQLPSILDERTIGSCGDLEVPLLSSANLTSLDLRELHAVKKIDSSFFGSSRGCAFPSLKDLNFTDLPNLEEWIGIDDCCMFPKLDTMEIINSPNLSGLPTLPCGLRKLYISNVGLTTLPAINENCENNNQQEHFQGLEYLTINQCDKLEYIPTEFFQKFNTVKSLIIKKLPKLTTRGISDIRPPSILNKLTIESCGDLEVHLLQLLPNVTSLTKLELVDCASITSLPPAQVCAQWTMLSHLEIKNCKELSSFGGIQALVSLRELEIRGCDKLIEVALRQPPFPNDVGQKNAADCFLKLGKLSIDHHALLLMEPLRSLSSISNFTLYDASRLTSLPEEWLLRNHSALKGLHIQNAGTLQSLPQSMTKLCSLKSLYVGNAKLIRSLPDLPTSLWCLCITGCHPELKERCQRNIGLDWPKIANICYVWIELTYSEED